MGELNGMESSNWHQSIVSVLIGVLLLGGLCSCSETAEPRLESELGIEAEGEDGGQAKENAKLSKIERDLLALDKLTDAGDVDRAAAGLVRMRMKGAKFTAEEAAAYRDSLSLAYDRAIELADEGSKKGKAALKILQSNGAF